MRIASPAPSHCASCFNQNPQALHVDFDAFYDGPVINTDGLKVAIDDLIICDNCLRAAYALIPDEERDELRAKVEGLEAEVAHWESRVLEMQRDVVDALR